ncbi:U1 small nuclear ribonucleoprotein 70 kDa-like [Ambystoma mexicanum]|uniref:U1 small nuclear ribonucleoprotein 70 kDa-like n=1 Tax=Ambystoma mexicanum TaxID=8296 RepID=UPI0037E81BF9
MGPSAISSPPEHESPMQSSDKGAEKDTEKDVISKVTRDKERCDKERSDRASTSLDIGREIKQWKVERDKADEVALLQNECMGGQILLKLDGKSIEDIRQRKDQGKQDKRDKESEERLKDEGAKRKDRQR